MEEDKEEEKEWREWGGLNIEGATGEFMKKAKDDSRDAFQDIVEKVRATGFLPYKFPKVSFQVRAKVTTCFLSLDFILLPELPMVWILRCILLYSNIEKNYPELDLIIDSPICQKSFVISIDFIKSWHSLFWKL